MWHPVALLGAALLLQVLAEGEEPPHDRAKRLTTFGKSPSSDTDPKTAPKGKDCRGDEDCAALEFTTCKVDSDQKRRCLCHDYQPPANGECATKKRELHQNCNYDHECIHGAECIVNNTIFRNERRCYCRNGYMEEDNGCNSGSPVSSLVPLVMFAALALLVSHKKQVIIFT